MRLQLIYRAQDRVSNRYVLCSTAAKVVRCLHHYSTYTSDAITDAFVRIADVPCLAQNPDDSIKRHNHRPGGR